MSPDKDKALCAKYPKIFANRYADMRTTAMCWGFECGDGWYALIDALCARLQSMTDWNPNNARFPQVIATQVKEKYGGLRFYTEGCSEYQDGMIHMICALSERTCEVCGAPGKTQDDGWIRTLCKACITKS